MIFAQEGGSFTSIIWKNQKRPTKGSEKKITVKILKKSTFFQKNILIIFRICAFAFSVSTGYYTVLYFDHDFSYLIVWRRLMSCHYAHLIRRRKNRRPRFRKETKNPIRRLSHGFLKMKKKRVQVGVTLGGGSNRVFWLFWLFWLFRNF